VPHLQVKLQKLPIPVIHAGDTVILTEHTSVADAELEATALSAAGVGEALTVRLKIGGRLGAIATAPGRASILAGAWEMRP
jgi:hypothetical protein